LFDNDDVLSKRKDELHQRFMKRRGEPARSCSPSVIILFMEFWVLFAFSSIAINSSFGVFNLFFIILLFFLE